MFRVRPGDPQTVTRRIKVVSVPGSRSQIRNKQSAKDKGVDKKDEWRNTRGKRLILKNVTFSLQRERKRKRDREKGEKEQL